MFVLFQLYNYTSTINQGKVCPYNIQERLLRGVKRKGHQVTTFRSFESVVYLCECLSVLASLKT